MRFSVQSQTTSVRLVGCKIGINQAIYAIQTFQTKDLSCQFLFKRCLSVVDFFFLSVVLHMFPFNFDSSLITFLWPEMEVFNQISMYDFWSMALPNHHGKMCVMRKSITKYRHWQVILIELLRFYAHTFIYLGRTIRKENTVVFDISSINLGI